MLPGEMVSHLWMLTNSQIDAAVDHYGTTMAAGDDSGCVIVATLDGSASAQLIDQESGLGSA